jgi:hypothetical protein
MVLLPEIARRRGDNRALRHDKLAARLNCAADVLFTYELQRGRGVAQLANASPVRGVPSRVIGGTRFNALVC